MKYFLHHHRIVTIVLLCCSSLASAQLHFASLGNWGTGSVTQNTVAAILKARAKEQSLSLVISPGSNFIDGVNGLDDSHWNTIFEKPYEGPELTLPFFSVLGAHDWNGNYTAEILHTNITYAEGAEDQLKKLPKWTLPNFWYHYSMHFADATEASPAYKSAEASVGFIFIDTFVLSEDFPHQNITKIEWDFLRNTIEASVKIFDWVIVIGDKAMLSSGASKGDKYLSDTLRKLLKDYRVDAYISGNDYDMEVIEDGTLLHINCGTGAGADPLIRVKVDNSVLYVAKPGFCHHVLTKKKFYTEFIDGNTGNVAGNYTKTRNVRDRSWLDRFKLYQALPPITQIDIPEWKNLPANQSDLFVKVCGTIGLIISCFVVLIGAVTASSRTVKLALS